MQNKNGFTLIEVLLSILILSLLLFIAVPNLIKAYEKYQVEAFFDIFEADILFIQNKRMTTTSQAQIFLRENEYLILVGSKLTTRKYPNNFKYSLRANNTLEFNRKGSYLNPRTIFFTYSDTTYRVVFPLGKGRHYVEEV